MNRLLPLATLLLLLAPAVAQVDPGRDGELIKAQQQQERNRGKTEGVEDIDNRKTTSRRVNLADIQSKTRELNGLVQSLNADMKTLQQGMVPADMTQRLKRIEKLAKNLRNTLE